MTWTVVGVGGASNPNVNAVGPLEQAYADLVELVYGQLMAQSHLSSLYGLVTYSWDDAAQELRGDLSGVRAEIESRIADEGVVGHPSPEEHSMTPPPSPPSTASSQCLLGYVSA